MKRAFLFSIIFILLFTIFLLYSVFYLNITQMNELNLAETRNITKVDYVIDDIRSDLLGYLQLSVSIGSNSTNTIINVADTLPSPYTNPTTELSNYRSFINGTYANQTNLINSSNISVISLNTTAFESAPMLQFVNSNSSLNLNYSYTNLNKNELIVNGSSSITNYSITILLNSSCLNSNCSNATWAGGPPNVDSTTAALWHFDEGSGNYAYDSSGNGNTGNLSTSPVPAWVAGKFNTGMNFTGMCTVAASDSPSLDINDSLTVEMWFNAYQIGSGSLLLDKGASNSPGDDNYAIWISMDSKIYASIGNGTTYQNIISTNPVQTKIWYHVAFTANGTTSSNGVLKLYVNGVLDNSTPQTMSPISNSNSLYMGSWRTSGGYYYLGIIDEVAVYSRAKSASEIAADANLFHWDWSPIAMNNNLSAAWRFEEGSGNSSYDSSGNVNTLSFTATSSVVLLPSSVNKAYSINSTFSDNPMFAATEVNYSNVNANDAIYETSTASYSNTFTLGCQASGTCSCEGPSYVCYSLDACVNYGGCTATCPSAGSASTGSTCSISATGCSGSCIPGPGCSD
jgi:hypothetical protein